MIDIRRAGVSVVSACRAADARGVRESLRDLRGGIGPDPGIRETVENCLGWLMQAQDRSSTTDGGVARHYEFKSGWGASYPETTGYIIPTFLAGGLGGNRDECRPRAIRMLDWLASIQGSSGGFAGGTIARATPEPVVFNSGQILLGLAAGAEIDSRYGRSLELAADWLLNSQDSDGGWSRHGGPFAPAGAKTYHTHVAWGLLEAARISERERWRVAARANVEWALAIQCLDGWWPRCSLQAEDRPLTHTIGYALRGVIEAWRHFRDPRYLAAALRTGEGVLTVLKPSGFLPGVLGPGWVPRSSWSCLTGSSQIAICWLELFRATGDSRFAAAARSVNRFVRRTIHAVGPPELVGAVKGSFPFWGAYCRFQFPNWACKFTIDSNRLEYELLGRPD